MFVTTELDGRDLYLYVSLKGGGASASPSTFTFRVKGLAGFSKYKGNLARVQL